MFEKIKAFLNTVVEVTFALIFLIVIGFVYLEYKSDKYIRENWDWSMELNRYVPPPQEQLVENPRKLWCPAITEVFEPHERKAHNWKKEEGSLVFTKNGGSKEPLENGAYSSQKLGEAGASVFQIQSLNYKGDTEGKCPTCSRKLVDGTLFGSKYVHFVIDKDTAGNEYAVEVSDYNLTFLLAKGKFTYTSRSFEGWPKGVRTIDDVRVHINFENAQRAKLGIAENVGHITFRDEGNVFKYKIWLSPQGYLYNVDEDFIFRGMLSGALGKEITFVYQRQVKTSDGTLSIVGGGQGGRPTAPEC